MDLRRIAVWIARTSTEEHTGYNQEVVRVLDDIMMETVGVSPTAKPYTEGINSAVFDNRRGNIVVFTFNEEAANVALEVEGEFEEILPEIYDVQVWNKEDVGEKWLDPRSYTNVDQIFAIEMEKLRLLSPDELILWSIIEPHAAFGNCPELGITEKRLDMKKALSPGQINYYAREVLREKGINPGELSEADLAHFNKEKDRMLKAMQDLATRAYNLNVTHDDSHAWNVGWGRNDKLKFIDLESVDLLDYDLAPQSRR